MKRKEVGVSIRALVSPTGVVKGWSKLAAAISARVMGTDPKAAIAFVQDSGVNNFISFAFVGLEVLTGLLCAGILFFVNVENTISRKHLVLIEREKEEYARLGKEWFPADERNAREIAKQEEEAEAIYKEELKTRCEKKGLDFDLEYQKHLDKANDEKQKREAKMKLAKEKQDKKEAKRNQKLTKEKLDILKQKQAKREKKNETTPE